MSKHRILLKLFAKPRRHTWFFMIAATILVAILFVSLSTLNESIITTVLPAMIFAAISSMMINEILFGLVDRKRDVAVLIAVGVQRFLLGVILFVKTILYTSVSYLLGVALGSLLLLLEGRQAIIPPDLAVTLSSVIVPGPAILAGSYGTLYAFRLNVPEVLRQ